MRDRWLVLATSSFVVAVVGATAVSVSGQGVGAPETSQTSTWDPPRTPWGDPDLQGIWRNENTRTQRQRPARFGDRKFFTDEEMAELEQQALERYERALAEADPAGPRNRADIERTKNTVEEGIFGAEYNNVWMQQPQKPGPLRWNRTSQVVDPPHGQVPPYTPELIARVEAREEARKHRGEADTWEDRNLNERCMRPQAATGLAGTVRIVQSPGWVAILPDGFQYPLLVSLDGRGQVSSKIRGWFGRSRGHWEGDRLVIETTNFNDKQDGGPVLPSRRPLGFYLGSGETLRKVETYQRLGPDQLAYGLTTDDPSVYVEPYTVLRPMILDNDFLMLQSGCHEGNYGMPNILSAARADEDYAMRSAQEADEGRRAQLAAMKARTEEWVRTGQVRAAGERPAAVNPDR